MLSLIRAYFSQLFHAVPVPVTYSGCLVQQYSGFGTQTLVLENTFQVNFFQFYFNKKYVEVAINDFTMHLIISE